MPLQLSVSHVTGYLYLFFCVMSFHVLCLLLSNVGVFVVCLPGKSFMSAIFTASVPGFLLGFIWSVGWLVGLVWLYRIIKFFRKSNLWLEFL